MQLDDGLKARPGISKALTQAYIVQDVTFLAIKTFKEQRITEDGKLPLGEFDAQKLGTLVKAWSEAQDRVRIHRNKPLPGVLKHEARPKRGKHAQVLVLEPMSESGDESTGEKCVNISADHQDDKQGESAGVQAS